MNKIRDTRAIVLLTIGTFFSPAIYILLFGLGRDDSGLTRFIEFIILPLPAFISVMCLALGVGSFIATKRQSSAEPLSQSAAALHETRQMRSNILALTIGTILLGAVALGMLVFVIHLVRLDDGIFPLIFPGAVPICIIIVASVLIPINIRHIARQKKLLSK